MCPNFSYGYEPLQDQPGHISWVVNNLCPYCWFRASDIYIVHSHHQRAISTENVLFLSFFFFFHSPKLKCPLKNFSSFLRCSYCYFVVKLNGWHECALDKILTEFMSGEHHHMLISQSIHWWQILYNYDLWSFTWYTFLYYTDISSIYGCFFFKPTKIFPFLCSLLCQYYSNRKHLIFGE